MLFKKKKRKFKLIKRAITLCALGVGATATTGLAIMGIILAIRVKKEKSPLTKFLRVIRHFF